MRFGFLDCLRVDDFGASFAAKKGDNVWVCRVFCYEWSVCCAAPRQTPYPIRRHSDPAPASRARRALGSNTYAHLHIGTLTLDVGHQSNTHVKGTFCTHKYTFVPFFH